MTAGRTARLLLAATSAAMTLPFVTASATAHCDSPVNFLTGTGLAFNPRSVGCDVIAEDFADTPNDDSNTDWIMPGSTTGTVRWLEASEPVDGVVVDGEVLGSRIDINGTVSALRFDQGTDPVDGTPTDAFWDSQTVQIGRTASLTAVAVITVCRDAASLDCETVTYRGVNAS